MYTNNAYLNDSHIDRKDKSNPLIVTMCGTYKLYTKPKLPTWRPRGRVDFQLLNEAINVDAYAKQNHVSTNWFIRNFKMYTGTTPKQFILQKRINNAETLLQNKQYNIKEIAQIIGYDNPLYFSRIFQRTKGISPSEYRKNI